MFRAIIATGASLIAATLQQALLDAWVHKNSESARIEYARRVLAQRALEERYPDDSRTFWWGFLGSI